MTGEFSMTNEIFHGEAAQTGLGHSGLVIHLSLGFSHSSFSGGTHSARVNGVE
jgi:hypothetical protein